MNFKVQKRRSLLKAATFRTVVLTSDALVIYLITKKVGETIGLVILTNFASTFLYFIHERFWNKISWGRITLFEDDSLHTPV